MGKQVKTALVSLPIFSALIAAEPASAEGGNFLVQPLPGLMIWTLLAFLITMFVLKKFFFPKIQVFLEERRKSIAETVDAAERTRQEAEELLGEYRQRLTEARQQADEIVAHARKAAETHESEAVQQAKQKQAEMLAHTRKEIETETRLALENIRKEVADLTVIATEKITRKSLDNDDHRRLIEDALKETDFTVFGEEASRN